MIRVAVIDDHPLVLASLEGLLKDAADLQPVMAAADGQQLWRQLDDARPGVVVLDYDLARGDGLMLCRRLKERVRPPAAVIHSAYAGPSLALSARIAGADALIGVAARAVRAVRLRQRPLEGRAAAPAVRVRRWGEIVALTDSPPARISAQYATVADGGARAWEEGSSDA